jgi:hypothetical protein
MAASLNEALLAIQKDQPDLKKDSKNPHFGNTYVSLDAVLEAILPRLTENEILLTQAPTNQNGVPCLRTRLTHVPTGESVEDVMPLMLVKEDPQAQGSAITYARRYSLLTLLSLTADEDDDGEAARDNSTKVTTSTSKGW